MHPTHRCYNGANRKDIVIQERKHHPHRDDPNACMFIESLKQNYRWNSRRTEFLLSNRQNRSKKIWSKKCKPRSASDRNRVPRVNCPSSVKDILDNQKPGRRTPPKRQKPKQKNTKILKEISTTHLKKLDTESRDYTEFNCQDNYTCYPVTTVAKKKTRFVA